VIGLKGKKNPDMRAGGSKTSFARVKHPKDKMESLSPFMTKEEMEKHTEKTTRGRVGSRVEEEKKKRECFRKTPCPAIAGVVRVDICVSLEDYRKARVLKLIDRSQATGGPAQESTN